VATKLFFCDFAKYKIGRNKFKILQNDFAKILQNFAKSFLYLAKFCCVISLAKENLQNFVSYLICEMILTKFRKTLI